MPVACTIYSTRRTSFNLEELQSWIGAGGTAQSLPPGGSEPKIQVTLPSCVLTLTMGEPEGGLSTHLDGLRGFIWQCAGQKMTQAVYALIQRTHALRHAIGIVAEPDIRADAAALLDLMARAGEALVFAGASIHAADGTLLLAPEQVEEAHRPSYWPASLVRRKRTETLLGLRGQRVPASLPPVVSEEEVLLREPADVGPRALALYAVAARALPKGLGRGGAKSLVKGHESILTPSEAEFLGSFFPGSATKIRFGWRLEALQVLLWALGWIKELGMPSQPTEVRAVLAAIETGGSPSALLRVQTLRSASEILDHLDLIYRAHWVTTDARVRQIPPPEWLEPGVVQERHHALNWLTRCRNEEWDEVSTDT